MQKGRRTFLRTTSAAGLAASAATRATAQADPTTRPVGGRTPSRQGQSHLTNTTYATIKTRDGFGLGVRTEQGVLDVEAAEAEMRVGAPTSIEQVIGQSQQSAALQTLIERVGSSGGRSRHLIAEDAVRFGPAVTSPPKVLCIGLNYRAHVEEANARLPTTPIFFNKFNSSLNGHGGTIAVSKEHAKDFDYEAELVAVMGRTARNVSEEDALDYVFGYSVGQDFSARDLQMATSQWMMGKAGDGWGPIGPWLVSADQIDPQNLDIQLRVNGELRQSSNTRMMIFSVRQQIAYLSKHMTLEPGDVIFTGTPEGVILGYPKEKRAWLKAGDTLVTSIEKLGSQTVSLT